MSSARFIIGDVFEEMAKLPDDSVDCLITSPPFWNLRSYLPSDHNEKHRELGSEGSPAEFLGNLLALTREWRRILAPHGSLCVELGDSYSGSGGAGGDYDEGGLRDGAPRFNGTAVKARANRDGHPLAKSLCLLPTLYPASLAYGRNLLNPDDQLEPWRVRNLIVWHRPNPPVGALGDKVRPSTSYVTTACVSDKRWFDLDAERGPGSPNTHARLAKGVESRPNTTKVPPNGSNRDTLAIVEGDGGAPPLDAWFHDDASDADVWTIPTAPYAGSHYATFPPALPRRLINLMCPRSVCLVCGEPRRRIVESDPAVRLANRAKTGFVARDGREDGGYTGGFDSPPTVTLGWSDCGHNTWRRGIVCDPFAGSGTTLQAASELGRDSIGIDLDRRNLDLARSRLGMFLIEDEVPA